MDKSWEIRVLKASERSSEREESEFLELVDQANGKCTLEVARVLMKTFSDKPDYGTQERVNSVLGSGKREDAIVALLEELPRLVKEAPEWAFVLIGAETITGTHMLSSIASRMPAPTKKALRTVLDDPEFREFYPEAADITI